MDQKWGLDQEVPDWIAEAIKHEANGFLVGEAAYAVYDPVTGELHDRGINILFGVHYEPTDGGGATDADGDAVDERMVFMLDPDMAAAVAYSVLRRMRRADVTALLMEVLDEVLPGDEHPHPSMVPPSLEGLEAFGGFGQDRNED